MIRPFAGSDIKAASQMCFDAFGHEIDFYPQNLPPLIYEMMVRFYKRNSYMSFVMEEKQEIKAFLLGFWASDAFCHEEWLQNAQNSLSEEEKKLFLHYFSYLNNNGSRVNEISIAKTAVVGLFVSKGGGNGTLLLEHFEQCAKNLGAQNTLLWADSFCAHDYYQKKGYTRFCKDSVPSFLLNKTEDLYIFQKVL